MLSDDTPNLYREVRRKTEALTELADNQQTSVFVLDRTRLGEARLGPFVGEEQFDQSFRTPRDGRKDGMPATPTMRSSSTPRSQSERSW